MAKFINKTNDDVYVDLGDLLLVRPGQIIDLAGAHTCHPLTLLDGRSKEAKKAKAKSRKSKSS